MFLEEIVFVEKETIGYIFDKKVWRFYLENEKRGFSLVDF